jgi:hypothetical protein
MILIKLILAHLLGDFVLQPMSMVRQKEAKGIRSPFLYLHLLIHALLVIILVWDARFIVPAIIITVMHGVIDVVKIRNQNETNTRTWFIADQLLHLAVLVSVWYMVVNPVVAFHFSPSFIIILTGGVFITTPTSVIIKILVSRWAPATNTINSDSLENAGKFIGILERLLVFTFALTDNWEAIGFLITAKSVFRFGDLKDAKDLKLTEYVLIGTLLSFGIAIGVSLLVKKAFLLV